MNPIERENQENRKYKKYAAVSVIILSLFIFFLCANGFIAEITAGYQAFLYETLGKTNRWSGSYGTESFVHLMDEISALGGRLFVSLFSICFGGYLYIKKRYKTLYTYFFVVIGAGVFHVFLKNFYGGEPWFNLLNIFLIDEKGFPSGHALMSVVLYFTLARLIYRANPDRRLNHYVMALAFLLSLIIGISQIIKGAHSPNEIIAGWAMGFAWINAAWLLDHYIRKKIYLHKHIKHSSQKES